ncbi:MAG: hypothetical protein C4347_02010, partial [Patescibacteria group bacterium]
MPIIALQNAVSFRLIADEIRRAIGEVPYLIAVGSPFFDARLLMARFFYAVVEGPAPWNFIMPYTTVVVPSRFAYDNMINRGWRIAGIVPHAVPTDLYNRPPRPPLTGQANLLYIAPYISRKYGSVSGLSSVKYPFSLTVITTKDNPYLDYFSKFGTVYTEWGKLNRDKLLELYSSSHFYLNLSTSEGFGLTVLEALASGRPVIHADFMPLSEITTPECSVRFPYGYTKTYPIPGGLSITEHRYSEISLAQAINRALQIYYEHPKVYRYMCDVAYERSRS